MGIIYGNRPRLTGVHDITDIQAYGLSFIGNGNWQLENFNDEKVVLDEIRRNIIAHQDPIDLKFIQDNS